MGYKYEYALMPVTYDFNNMNELVDGLNDIGNEGWEIVETYMTHLSSPLPSTNTIDYMCKRKKRWWRKAYAKN